MMKTGGGPTKFKKTPLVVERAATRQLAHDRHPQAPPAALEALAAASRPPTESHGSPAPGTHRPRSDRKIPESELRDRSSRVLPASHHASRHRPAQGA